MNPRCPLIDGRPLFHQASQLMTGNPQKTHIAFKYLTVSGTDTGQEDLHHRGVFIGKGGRKGGVSLFLNRPSTRRASGQSPLFALDPFRYGGYAAIEVEGGGEPQFIASQSDVQ